jgi:hypothetical protein
VTTLRCFRCGAEQTVIGPSTFPTYEYPGWKVEESQFYNPGGRHFCARHARRNQIVYCEEILDCVACMGSEHPFVANAPITMGEAALVEALNSQGVTCHGGNRFLSVEDVLDDETEVDVVL